MAMGIEGRVSCCVLCLTCLKILSEHSSGISFRREIDFQLSNYTRRVPRRYITYLPTT